MTKDWITVQAAAEALGISVSTFKRSCEGFGIPIARTPGGHRRIDKAAIALAQRALKQHRRIGEQHEPFAVSQFLDELSDLLLGMRVGSVGDLLRKSAESMGSMIELIEAGVAPLLWTIGSQVANGDRPVYQEKLITQSICRSLSNLIETYRVVGELPVRALGATFPPSTDTVGSTMIHLACVEAGVRAVDLGPSVPPEVIADAARDLHVEVVWINHTHVIDPQKVIADHEKLHQLLPSGVRVVVGGGGLSPSVRRQLTQCVYYETIQSMIAEQFPESTPMRASSLMPGTRGV